MKKQQATKSEMIIRYTQFLENLQTKLESDRYLVLTSYIKHHNLNSYTPKVLEDAGVIKNVGKNEWIWNNKIGEITPILGRRLMTRTNKFVKDKKAAIPTEQKQLEITPVEQPKEVINTKPSFEDELIAERLRRDYRASEYWEKEAKQRSEELELSFNKIEYWKARVKGETAVIHQQEEIIENLNQNKKNSFSLFWGLIKFN